MITILRSDHVLIIFIVLRLIFSACYVYPGNDSLTRNIKIKYYQFERELHTIDSYLSNKTQDELKWIKNDVETKFNELVNIKNAKTDLFLIDGNLNRLFEACSTNYSLVIEKINSRIRAFIADSLKVDLTLRDTLFRQMLQSAYEFRDQKDQKGLDSIKTNAKSDWDSMEGKLQSTLEKYDLHKDKEIEKLHESIRKTRNSIDQIQVRSINKLMTILDYIWKIALPVVLLFIMVNMIRNNIKSKKSQKFFKEKDTHLPKI